MKMPNKPTGNTDKVNYDREMWDVIRSLTPLPGPGIEFTRTSVGIIYSVKKNANAGGSTSDDLTWLT